MNESKRGSLITGAVLLALGALFMLLNFIPGLTANKTWPLIFLVLAVGFFLPAFIWPKSREGLAGLFIPGCILVALGAIFLFNTFTGQWGIWAFAWILIPAAVGLGLLTSAWVGEWDRGVYKVGKWLLIISLAVFAFFAALFGSPLVKIIGAGLLVLAGLGLLIRSLLKKDQPL